MNTPSHAILSLAILHNKHNEKYSLPIVLGGFVPDIPIFIFYCIEKFFFQAPEQLIWGELYFLPQWQDFFDIFNSIPLIGFLLCIAFFFKWKWVQFLNMSMILHCLFDLPLHNDDAHRHFFPFSNYRFESPVSYWDPANHGAIFSVIEFALSGILCLYLYRKMKSQLWKNIAIIMFFFNVILWIFAVFFWGG